MKTKLNKRIIFSIAIALVAVISILLLTNKEAENNTPAMVLNDPSKDFFTDTIVQLGFEEESGEEAMDTSGYQRNASLKGDASRANDRNGSVVQLDGVKSYVELPTGIANNLKNMTIATWVKLDDVEKEQRIFDFGAFKASGMHLEVKEGAMNCILRDSKGKAEYSMTVPTLPKGVWQHVTIVLSEGTGKIYINGKEAVANASMAFDPVARGEFKNNFLGKSQNKDAFMKGALDDFQVINRALTENEIYNMVNSPSTTALYIHADEPKFEMSPLLYGVFFEEINHAGDGGIYAELIKNRSFEANGSNTEDWTMIQTGNAKGSMALESNDLLNEVQKRALRLDITQVGSDQRVGIANKGYWGIAVSQDAKYKLSFFAKCSAEFKGPLTVSLESNAGKLFAKAQISEITHEWKKYECELVASDASALTGDNALVISASQTGTVWFDVVSLFPETWRDQPNGLRKDLANAVEALEPKVMRFPGGCFVEGYSMQTADLWKPTIGSIEERPGHASFWGYHTTNGLGYHEFLLWCEELGAEPLFCVNSGMSHGDHIPLDQMDASVQDALDAIEYANGSVDSRWGAIRAKNGHPEPFNLKYIQIGNEEGTNEMIGPYMERYPLFYKAIKEKYPDVQIVWNATGPQPHILPDGIKADIVDEHIYTNSKGLYKDAEKFDSIDRNNIPKIFIGEYASCGADWMTDADVGTGNLRGALGEGALLIGLERNSDLVVMATYAPLFANINNKSWNPQAIYYDSTRMYCTPSYYMQKMFSQNYGDVYLPVEYKANEKYTIGGAVGVGTANAQVEFSEVKVTAGSEVLLLDKFTSNASAWREEQGDWTCEGGVYKQTNADGEGVAYIGNQSWSNYTYQLKAKKTGGKGGFSVIFGAKNASDYYSWHLGGAENTENKIIKHTYGIEEVLSSVEGMDNVLIDNKEYSIEIVAEGNVIQCIINGIVFDEINVGQARAMKLYYGGSIDKETGDIIIKVVNPSESARTVEMVFDGVDRIGGKAEEIVLTSSSQDDENSFEEPEKIIPIHRTLEDISSRFEYSFAPNSATVLRIPQK